MLDIHLRPAVSLNTDPMTLSILIPVFNEVSTITALVERVRAVPLDQEIILVNDGSTDGTYGVVNKLVSTRLKVIHHKTNHGKGASIRTAIEAATGDMVVIQDADFEYDPRDLPRLLSPISKGQANVVYGVRSLESQKLIMRFGNWFITSATNMLYDRQLKDVETCYKMMRRDIAFSLDLECRRFDVEAEITAKLLRAGYTIYELPISYTARRENKKLSPRDGFPTVCALWEYRNWKPKR